MRAVSGMQDWDATQPTAKYAQRCEGGVTTAIVGVYLGHEFMNGVNVYGNGRLHRAVGLQNGGKHATEPAYCKYHTLEATENDANPPPKIKLEYRFSIHEKTAYYDFDLNGGAASNNGDAIDGKLYRQLNCTIELEWQNTFDADARNGICHVYGVKNVTYPKALKDDIQVVVNMLATMNKYTLEFQTLHAHAEVPVFTLACVSGIQGIC